MRRLWVLLLGLLLSSPAYVNSAGNASTAVAKTMKVVVPSSTAGNTFVVAVSWDSSGSVTISDKQGNTWTQDVTDFLPVASQSLAIWHAFGIKGGVDTVTATWPVNHSYRRLTVLEYSGLPQTVHASKAQGNSGTAITVPIPSGFLVCAYEPSLDSVTPAAGLTKRKAAAAEMQVADGVGSACNGTISASENWMGQGVSFTSGIPAAGSLPQTIKVHWRPGVVAPGDTLLYYYVVIAKDGRTSRQVFGDTVISAEDYVNAGIPDTLDSAEFDGIPAPDSGKTSEYVVQVLPVLKSGNGWPATMMFRRTNTAKAPVPLDTVPMQLTVAAPMSFGIFGDSFHLYRRPYVDTASAMVGAKVYVGTLFPHNMQLTVPGQVRTYRYSYYLVGYLFGLPSDTTYVGTLEFNNP